MLGCNKSGCFVVPVITHKFDFCSKLYIFVLKRSIRRYVVQEQGCRNSRLMLLTARPVVIFPGPVKVTDLDKFRPSPRSPQTFFQLQLNQKFSGLNSKSVGFSKWCGGVKSVVAQLYPLSQHANFNSRADSSKERKYLRI